MLEEENNENNTSEESNTSENIQLENISTDSENSNYNSQKNTKHIKFRLSFSELYTLIILLVTPILFIISFIFIKPTLKQRSFYNLYFLLYFCFSIFVYISCIFLSISTKSMKSFYKTFINNKGKFSFLDSKNKKIKNICDAYKESFLPYEDKDYHKTRANSDLYFGVDTWLQDFNFIPLQSFLKIIPGTFIGFGILGTFVGFSEGLTEIKVIDGDLQSITTGVQLLLDGLKKAFNTSIIGVLTSIYINYLVIHPFLNKITIISKQLCDYLDSKFYVSEIEAMSISETQPFPTTLRYMMDKLETASSNITHLEMAFGKQLSEKIKSTMDEQIKEIIQDEIIKLKSHVDETVELLTNCSIELKSVPQELKNATLSMNNFFDSYCATLTTISDKMISINSDLDKLPEQFRSVADSIDSTSKSVVNNSDSFNKAFEKSTNTLEKTTEITSRIAQSVESQVLIINKSTDQIKDVMDESNKISEKSRELVSDYTHLDEHLSNIFNEVNSNTMKYSEILRESLEGYFKHFQNATKNISNQFAEATLRLAEEIEKLNIEK